MTLSNLSADLYYLRYTSEDLHTNIDIGPESKFIKIKETSSTDGDTVILAQRILN